MFKTDTDVEFSDPRVLRTVVFNVANVEIPARGEYHFDLYADGVFVMARRIVVRQTSMD